MNIARKEKAKKIVIGGTMAAYEYPIMDKVLHGAVVALHGRYLEQHKEVE